MQLSEVVQKVSKCRTSDGMFGHEDLCIRYININLVYNCITVLVHTYCMTVNRDVSQSERNKTGPCLVESVLS